MLGCRVALVSPPAVPPSGGMQAYVEWLNGLLDHESMAATASSSRRSSTPRVVMRRETLAALGGWRDIDGPEDYDLWLRAFDAGHRFAKLPEVLLRWRDRPERLTRTDPRYAPERFLALKLAALGRGPLATEPPGSWSGAPGPVGKAWARALRAAGHRVEAFVEVDPRQDRGAHPRGPGVARARRRGAQRGRSISRRSGSGARGSASGPRPPASG